MITMQGARWFVVQTQVHAENKAMLNLGRQGFVSYMPRYLKRRRHARRVDIVPAPLFPRYLFVSIDETQRWRSIQSTLGVSHLVCTGDDPVPVPAGVIEQLKAREDERGFVRLDTRPPFAPGDKVQVLDGVFSNCLGLFEGMTDSDRVTILLDFLGRKVRVALHGGSVAAA